MADIPDVVMRKFWDDHKNGPEREKVRQFLIDRKAKIRHEKSDLKRAPAVKGITLPPIDPKHPIVPMTTNQTYGWYFRVGKPNINDAYGRTVHPIGDLNKKLGWPSGVAM